jgi:hypothetical protein
MTINNFTPTLWAGALLKNLNDAHVYGQVFNRDYEGEIRDKGDTVKINMIGRVTTFAYTKNSDMTAPETLDDSQLTLLIDQSRGFNFQIDDVDKAQNNLSVMSEAMREAAWALADDADVFGANVLNANVDTANVLTAATVGTGAGDDDMYEVLVDLGTQLTENNVPMQGRWVVVAPGHEALLRKDPRWVSFGTSENRRQLSGEPVKNVAGFDLMVSNNVPSGTDILAGYSGAATWADQIPEGKVEAYTPELRFADAVKGLRLYGAKVTRSYALAKVVATIA